MNYWGVLALLFPAVALVSDVVSAFTRSQQYHKTTTTTTTKKNYDGHYSQFSSKSNNNNDDDNYDYDSRRNILTRAIEGFTVTTLGVLSMPSLGFAATGSKSLSEEYRQGTAALADMDELAPVPREAYKKLPSGVTIADLRPGPNTNDVVKQGSRVNMQWVLRKSNGYFVDSSQVAYDGVPFIFTVGDGTAIAGVDEGVLGMSTGGTRRLLIPPSLAYVNGLEDGKPGPLPVGFGPRQQMRRVQQVRKDVPGEYIFLEVQVTRVRN